MMPYVGGRQWSWHGRDAGRYRVDNTGYFKGLFSRTGLFLTPLPCRTDFLLAEQKSSGGRSKLFDNSASKAHEIRYVEQELKYR